MDGLLLRINYDFLTDLSRSGLVVGDIRVRMSPRSKHTRVSTFKTYSSGDAYLTEFAQAALDPRFLCGIGLFPFIEVIKVTNTNLGYHTQYRWYNLFGVLRLDTTVQQDDMRAAKYASDVARYEELQRQRISRYVADATAAGTVRLGEYVDPCYVDAGYVTQTVL